MNNIRRCDWCLGFDKYIEYHDKEWGVPNHDDQVHFEFLVLEGAQAGLSWSSILKKREGYRKAFAGFNVARVALFTERHISRLLSDSSIIRNKMKIRSAISNAKCFMAVQKEFGSFDKYIWGFVNYRTVVNRWEIPDQVPASSDSSDALSKDMKRRGFKFAGNVILYSHMQACGLVNDHLVSCFRHKEIVKMSSS